MRRRVAVTVPHFLIAPFVVSQSDYIVTLAERVAATFANLLPLRLLKPPIDLPPWVLSWSGTSEWNMSQPSNGYARPWLRSVSSEADASEHETSRSSKDDRQRSQALAWDPVFRVNSS